MATAQLHAVQPKTSLQCEWWGEGQKPKKGELAELSSSGAYVRTGEPGRMNSDITIRFNAGLKTVELRARIIHQTDGVAAMGVEFIFPDSEQRSTFEESISGLFS